MDDAALTNNVLVGVLLCCTGLLLILRISFLLFQIQTNDGRLQTSSHSLPIIICIGSGGHTTEMLRIVGNLNLEKYKPRLYIVAENDVTSEVKIHKLEDNNKDYSLKKIQRSRNVSQSFSTSVFTTLYATLQCIPLVYKFQPALVLCNGPGSCVPVCIVVFLLRCCFLVDCRIVFIESICRVRSLSLTGQILRFIADLVIVQWPQLRDVCSRAKYFGKLT